MKSILSFHVSVGSYGKSQGNFKKKLENIL